MQPADLTLSLLSSAERPLMPSWEWSIAFKVAWKRKTWEDCSGIEAALRSQVRTASGSHKACGETDYQEQQSEFTAFFTHIKSPQKPDKWVLPKVALGYAGRCASPLRHFTVTSKEALFFLYFHLFFLPQLPMQSPSSTIILLWQEQPNSSAQSQKM